MESFPGSNLKLFDVGDLVLLRANPIFNALSKETKKVLLLCEGPYKIKARVKTATYILEDLDSGIEQGMFHASHLKAYILPSPSLEIVG